MSKYNEPWHVTDNVAFTSGPSIVDAIGNVIVVNHCDTPSDAVSEEHAERIVACVNFCREFPTEWLREARLVVVNADFRPELARAVGFEGRSRITLTKKEKPGDA